MVTYMVMVRRGRGTAAARLDVTKDWLQLVSSHSGAVFGRAKDQRLNLRLRRQDADVEQDALSGELEEIGAADVVDFLLVAEDLIDQARQDRAAVVVTRAMHLESLGRVCLPG